MVDTPIFERNYKEKPCGLCGVSFKPTHPRAKSCPSCLVARCVDCGVEISASFERRNRQSERRCMGCHELRELPAGTRRIDYWGYVVVKLEDGSWKLEHRLVMEKKLGRELLSVEHIHHEDENKQNNDPGNLILTKGLRDHLDTYHADLFKLDIAKARLIYEDCQRGLTHREIGRKHGIDNSVVCRIARGEAWKRLGLPPIIRRVRHPKSVSLVNIEIPK